MASSSCRIPCSCERCEAGVALLICVDQALTTAGSKMTHGSCIPRCSNTTCLTGCLARLSGMSHSRMIGDTAHDVRACSRDLSAARRRKGTVPRPAYARARFLSRPGWQYRDETDNHGQRGFAQPRRPHEAPERVATCSSLRPRRYPGPGASVRPAAAPYPQDTATPNQWHPRWRAACSHNPASLAYQVPHPA
jgi:hypothetical protein